ncbi:MAG: AIR synthase related protein, partial [Planctomycetota bacterium]
MRERELLDAIRERSSGIALDGADLLAGPGDDCAVVRTGSDTLLVTVDQLVEGRHYESGTGLDLIARKSIARSISDVAAMAGEPVWATATGLLPDGFEHGDQLFDAMKR